MLLRSPRIDQSALALIIHMNNIAWDTMVTLSYMT